MRVSVPVTLLASLLFFAPPLHAQSPQPHLSSLDLEHQDPQWAAVKAHLPDPATASPAELELEADILRARRFPEEAIQFYNYALQRGARPALIFKKLGVTELELHNMTLARLYFERVIKLNRRDAEAWNNLGAVEFLEHRFAAAISDDRRAVKLQRNTATFHSNLAIAYIENKDFESARKELVTAVRIDPTVFQHSGNTGISAQLLSTDDHARFCFEMARAYAHANDIDEMLHQLSRASEAGFDVLAEMSNDPILAKYRSDPRVILLVRIARTMRAGKTPPATIAGATPPLPAIPPATPR